jgi:L-asparaginase II
MFPRSSNKPLQAAAMRGCGLDVEEKLLALAAASHSGEAFHVTGIREILAGAGLTEEALQCPRALPLDETAQQQVLREGGAPARVYMNCSGKHAAMLAACVTAGWPIDSYRSPAHPLQRRIRQLIERLSGQSVTVVGVDGCGAPLFAISLTALARAYRALVLAEPGSPPRAVADAMRAYPDWTSGTRRPERALMEAVPGLLVKSGAEGGLAFAFPDGQAAAFKVDDGAQRAVPVLAVALLRQLGVQERDAGALSQIAHVPVYGGEAEAGEIRAVFPRLHDRVP